MNATITSVGGLGEAPKQHRLYGVFMHASRGPLSDEFTSGIASHLTLIDP